MIIPPTTKLLALTKPSQLFTKINIILKHKRNFACGVVCSTSTRNFNVNFFRQRRNKILQDVQIRLSSSMTPATPVFHHALKYSDRLALTDDTTSYTYSQLFQYASQLAARLGERPGAKVAFLTPNSGDYVAVQWAIWMCGGVAVPLCRTHPTDLLRYYVEDSQAGLVVVTQDLEYKVEGLGEVMLVEGMQLGDEVEVSHVVVDKEDPAMILYTSGTTGPPKGVVLTHSNLEHQADCLISSWSWTQEDSILHVLPLHHTHGVVNCLLCPLTVGASVVMMGSFEAGKVWDMLLAKPSHVNVFMAVPTIYAKLLEHFNKSDSGLERENVEKACVENIRLMVSGSAALPTPVLHQWREVSGHTLLERYGMTEIGMALSNPLHGERVPGCVGTPLPGVEAKIVRWQDDGGHTILAEGEEGELLVRGPNVFKEYFNKPAETSKEFTEEGWFKTGDTARVEDGLFRILGRTSVDIIKTGGYKVSALDVERVLLSHPDILDVAVVGVEDITWGQKVAALVVLRSASTLDLVTLKTWCQDKMANYWVPTELRLLEEMPRNAMGKVNKKEMLKNIFPK